MSVEQRDLRRSILETIGLGLAYYIAAKLSLHLSLVGRSITPLWPPTGIAVAGFIIFGRSRWPGVAAGAFLANLGTGPAVIAATGISVGNTLAPVTAAWLLERAKFHPELDRLRDAVSLVFLGALVSMGISATGGVTTLLATGDVAASSFPSAWAVWWAGDAMGVLAVAPFLLSLRRLDRVRHRLPELVLALAATGVVSFLLFDTALAIRFVVFPVLGLVAWRLGQQGAAPAALIATSVAVAAAVQGKGEFAGQTLAGQMVTLQAFNAGVALTSFVLAALTTERAAARASLERAAGELEERVERRTAELTELNERFVEAQELVHLGSWSWDVATGNVEWSLELYRIYGQPAEEDLGYETYISRVHPDDRGAAISSIDRTVATGEPFAQRRRIVRPDGDVRWVYATGQAVTDVHGDVRRLFGTCQDITEQVRAEEALHATEERFRRIAESANDAILAVNDQYVITYRNPAAMQMFGEVQGLPVTRLIATAPAAISSASHLLDTNARALDGRSFPVVISIATTSAQGEFSHSLIIRDVTVTKALEEELRRLNDAKTEFIATAAHELRTPLSAIDGIAELLRLRAELTEDQTDDLIQRLRKQAARLGKLFSNLLDVSQIDAGVLRVVPQVVPLETVLRSALEASRPPDGKRVSVSAGHVDVVAQRERLEQILVNLLTNAYRYGGDRIVIEASAHEGEALVSVADDGAGVGEELAPHIFDRFRRSNDGASDAAGLGLSIVRGLVEAHGGRVWYERDDGWSRFRFTLPLASVGEDLR